MLAADRTFNRQTEAMAKKAVLGAASPAHDDVPCGRTIIDIHGCFRGRQFPEFRHVRQPPSWLLRTDDDYKIAAGGRLSRTRYVFEPNRRDIAQPNKRLNSASAAP